MVWRMVLTAYWCNQLGVPLRDPYARQFQETHPVSNVFVLIQVLTRFRGCW